MLNPNEIASKRFDKTMSGYKVDDVEAFLDRVAQDFAQLLNERYDLEQKISVLADKLEEYKRDEESLKSAVFEAQKLGSSLVREAQTKSERIVQEATEKGNFITTDASQRADQMLAEVNAQCEQTRHEQEVAISEQQTYYDRLRAEVSAFRKQIMSAYREHLELIQQLPAEVEQEISAREQAQVDTAKPAEPEPQPAPEPEPAPEETPAPPASDESEFSEPQYAAPAPEYDPETLYDPETDPLPDVPVETPASEPVRMTGPEPKPTDGYSITDEPTREIPPMRDGRHGLLKFGENYNMREDREPRGRRKK